MTRTTIILLIICVFAALLAWAVFLRAPVSKNSGSGEGVSVTDPGVPANETPDDTSRTVVETRIDQGASALDVKVVPIRVLEDSRCPEGVACIQEGTVRVRALLSSGLGSGEQEFELGQPITTEAEIVTLIEVAPEPHAGVAIDAGEYRFRFEIAKR